MSPPPPTGMKIAWMSLLYCRRISIPIVPWYKTVSTGAVPEVCVGHRWTRQAGCGNMLRAYRAAATDEYQGWRRVCRVCVGCVGACVGAYLASDHEGVVEGGDERDALLLQWRSVPYLAYSA
eukprot:1317828-Rhodomonas_salina.2